MDFAIVTDIQGSVEKNARESKSEYSSPLDGLMQRVRQARPEAKRALQYTNHKGGDMKALRYLILLVVLFVTVAPLAHGQAGFDDDRVMLQGFYWESYRHGHEKFPQFGSKRWYKIVQEHADTLREGHFDLIWLPPPSYAGDFSAGYGPKEYFNLSNSYGSFEQHRAMIEGLLLKGIEPDCRHRHQSSRWPDQLGRFCQSSLGDMGHLPRRRVLQRPGIGGS